MRNAILLLAMAVSVWAAGNGPALTLDQALELASKNNRALRIAALHTAEMQQHTKVVRADMFPKATTGGYGLLFAARQRVAIPAGSLGTYDAVGPIPGSEVLIDQGSRGLMLTESTVTQPLTQLLKLHEAVKVARLDEGLAELRRSGTENDVRVGVTQLYFGVLMAEAQHRAVLAAVAAAEASLQEAETAVEASTVLPGVRMEAEAAVAAARQASLASELQLADLRTELNEALGVPLDRAWRLAMPVVDAETRPQEALLALALENNEEMRSAALDVEKARAAVRAAKLEYVPDVAAFVQHTYQKGVPLLASNNGAAGVRVEWTVFDGGKRKSAISEQRLVLEQAEENVRRLRDSISVKLAKALHNQARLHAATEDAMATERARAEADRVAADQLEAEVITNAMRARSAAALEQARAAVLAAQMNESVSAVLVRRVAGVAP